MIITRRLSTGRLLIKWRRSACGGRSPWGRIREPEGQEKIEVPVSFRARQAERKYDDPFLQAEYAYSLIESEG